jgi:hypothetical protein
MRFQLLELYCDIEFCAAGFSILTFGWHEHALLSLHFVGADEELGAQISGSFLYIKFCFGGKGKGV